MPKPSGLLTFAGDRRYGAILADPPWQFSNRTGKVAPEHKRLNRYRTMTLAEIKQLPVSSVCADKAHLYLWVPNALIREGIDVMEAWGFTYKTNIVWRKVRKDGGPDGRGVGFYFRNTTELVLFGTRGKLRTREAGRRQVNILRTMKREHSRKPDELYPVIESCSPGPYLELFARGRFNKNWDVWGDEAGDQVMPKRIQRKRTAGWRMPEGAVYVGRPTVWGNPYKTAEEFRSLIEAIIGVSGQSEFHKTTLHQFSHVHHMVGRLNELRNKDLACWCPLDKPCHADVLLELANR